MPRGHSLSIYARFSGKKRTSKYISQQKGDHYYILHLGKLKEKFIMPDSAYAPWASHNTP